MTNANYGTQSINLNIFGGKVYEEGVEWFGYTASVFDPFQQWKYKFPVVNTAANVLLLVVVRVHSITLCHQTQKKTAEYQGEKPNMPY